MLDQTDASIHHNEIVKSSMELMPLLPSIIKLNFQYELH
jgi:hypothetical protein